MGKKIETVKKIESIEFYKMIYNKACNSFWELRPTFMYLLMIGMILTGIMIAQIIDNYIFKYLHTPKDGNIFKMITFILLLCGPTMIFFVKSTICNKKNSKYVCYLRKIKKERSLNSNDIDSLIEDIKNLKFKYKKERDYIASIFFKLATLFIFPLTAAIFTGLINDVYFAILILALLVTPVISLVLSFRTNFDFFKNIGIRNYYLISVVERELEYMKKLK